jgi:hypothetical protein
MHLGVLRVLIEQTLEISSMVKNPTQPSPRLVTEVKDSSLTILHQLRFIAGATSASRAQVERFSSREGALFGEDQFNLDSKREI